jgi:hypothetical protein
LFSWFAIAKLRVYLVTSFYKIKGIKLKINKTLFTKASKAFAFLIILLVYVELGTNDATLETAHKQFHQMKIYKFNIVVFQMFYFQIGGFHYLDYNVVVLHQQSF